MSYFVLDQSDQQLSTVEFLAPEIIFQRSNLVFYPKSRIITKSLCIFPLAVLERPQKLSKLRPFTIPGVSKAGAHITSGVYDLLLPKRVQPVFTWPGSSNLRKLSTEADPFTPKNNNRPYFTKGRYVHRRLFFHNFNVDSISALLFRVYNVSTDALHIGNNSNLQSHPAVMFSISFTNVGTAETISWPASSKVRTTADSKCFL